MLTSRLEQISCHWKEPSIWKSTGHCSRLLSTFLDWDSHPGGQLFNFLIAEWVYYNFSRLNQKSSYWFGIHKHHIFLRDFSTSRDRIQRHSNLYKAASHSTKEKPTLLNVQKKNCLFSEIGGRGAHFCFLRKRFRCCTQISFHFNLL